MRASRVKCGDVIELFNVNGTFRKAVVINISKSATEVELLEDDKKQKTTDQTKVSLGVALPKGNRSDWLLEKVTELGVSEVWPIQSTHSVLKLQRNLALRKKRWERIIQQAAKQSLTPIIPVLHSPVDFDFFIKNYLNSYDMIVWGCMPQRGLKTYQLYELTKPRNALLLIGPEGDFSQQEQEMLQKQKAIPVSLSFNRLRTETAAIVLVSMTLLVWNHFIKMKSTQE
jgi:16S rRNA (uracil1498-N3)-methyltransferase